MPDDHFEPGMRPSAWVLRFAPLIAPGGAVLDLACGGGRHARFFLAAGHPVTAVDRDLAGLGDLTGASGLEPVEADLEGAAWPLPGRRFAAAIVANYLWRPLFPDILASLEPQGVLLYETFARGNERFGRPRNPDFLLGPGELLELVRGRLHVVAYETGITAPPREAAVQRLAAINQPTDPEGLSWLP
jgi:SAM-dependent methyltransferase